MFIIFILNKVVVYVHPVNPKYFGFKLGNVSNLIVNIVINAILSLLQNNTVIKKERGEIPCFHQNTT